MLFRSTKAFWTEAAGFGLRDGLVVPLRCVAGGRASLVMAGHSAPTEASAIAHQLGMTMGFISELTEQLFEQVLIDNWRRGRRPETVLTDHQREILQMLAQGLTIKEVARGLDISPRAVQHATDRVQARMGVSSTLEAKFSAWSLGLIEPRFEILDFAEIDRVSLFEG